MGSYTQCVAHSIPIFIFCITIPPTPFVFGGISLSYPTIETPPVTFIFATPPGGIYFLRVFVVQLIAGRRTYLYGFLLLALANSAFSVTVRPFPIHFGAYVKY